MTTADLLLIAWDKDPFVIGECSAALIFYAVWCNGRIRARAAFFALSAAIFVLSLVSPIGVLARGYLFSAHMLQHILLVLVVPPLALLALPQRSPPTFRDDAQSKGALHFFAPWILGVGAMWLWHEPTLCNAASRSLPVLRAQTLSLVAMGSAFWWPILGPSPKSRFAPFAAMAYLFTACIACTALGVLVTFSPIEVCSIFAHPVDHLGALRLLQQGWGLTPNVDQQIGGLLMWVPGCLIYALSILIVYARYQLNEEHDVDAESIDASGEASTRVAAVKGSS